MCSSCMFCKHCATSVLRRWRTCKTSAGVKCTGLQPDMATQQSKLGTFSTRHLTWCSGCVDNTNISPIGPHNASYCNVTLCVHAQCMRWLQVQQAGLCSLLPGAAVPCTRGALSPLSWLCTAARQEHAVCSRMATAGFMPGHVMSHACHSPLTVSCGPHCFLYSRQSLLTTQYAFSILFTGSASKQVGGKARQLLRHV